MAVVVPETVSGRITVEHRDGVDVLRMVGEIDSASISAYEAEQRSDDTFLITAVDLSEVTYLSSSGIGFLLRRTRPARDLGEVPQLRGASSSARRILMLTGVAPLFQASNSGAGVGAA